MGIPNVFFFDGKYLFTELFLTMLNRNNKQKTNIPNHKKNRNMYRMSYIDKTWMIANQS